MGIVTLFTSDIGKRVQRHALFRNLVLCAMHLQGAFQKALRFHKLEERRIRRQYVARSSDGFDHFAISFKYCSVYPK